MTLLSLHGVSHSIANKNLFENISFALNENQRVALVGLNGAGKSTLLEVLRGSLTPEEGRVWRKPDIRVEKVNQFLPVEWRDLTLFDLVAENIQGGYQGAASDYLVEQAIEQISLPETLYFAKLATMSGGEVNRALLARALAPEPDLLLLDEPTNHMDTRAVEEFEALLAEKISCAMCIISHDRDLLDRVTSKTLFLRDRRIYSFDLAYSRAREALIENDAAAARRRRAEELEITRVAESAKKLAEWGRVFDNEKFSKRAKSMQKRVEKLKAQVTFVGRTERAQVSLGAQQADAKTYVSIERARIRIPTGRELFAVDGFWLRRGERVAIVGENGCGKSTFLKLLVQCYRGRDENAGVRLSPSISCGYFDQELCELDAEREVFGFLRHKTELPDQELVTALVRAGFPYVRHKLKIAVLSGGEKARLCMLLMKLTTPSLLILDEPTNHLDVQGIEQLEEDLLASSATCILVSHDRRFVRRVATRVARIENGVMLTQESSSGQLQKQAASTIISGDSM